MKKFLPIAILILASVSADDCVRCLGPQNFAGNPPVCPITCDGDFVPTISLLYWNAHQEGMEFAIVNDVPNSGGQQLNQLVEADYQNLHEKRRWGFQLGLSYCGPCDGWDLGLLWTRFHGKAHKDLDVDAESNHTLMPLWSQFTPMQAGILFANRSENQWKLKLNLFDFELGRKFWVSRYLSMRPYVSIRYASVRQHDEIIYRGGSWNTARFNGLVDLRNNYRGAGLRVGTSSEWNFGCGWAFYGNSAFTLLYGRFYVSHDEFLRAATPPFKLSNILDTEESFRASRGVFDLALGIQYSTLVCDCRYGLTTRLAWEQHLFFDQNQLWRVNRIGTTTNGAVAQFVDGFNLAGQNVFEQRRGSLAVQGVTLTFKLEY